MRQGRAVRQVPWATFPTAIVFEKHYKNEDMLYNFGGSKSTLGQGKVDA